MVGLPADLAPFLFPALLAALSYRAPSLVGLAPARLTYLGGSLPVTKRRSGPISTVKPLSIRSKIGLCRSGWRRLGDDSLNLTEDFVGDLVGDLVGELG